MRQAVVVRRKGVHAVIAKKAIAVEQDPRQEGGAACCLANHSAGPLLKRLPAHLEHYAVILPPLGSAVKPPRLSIQRRIDTALPINGPLA